MKKRFFIPACVLAAAAIGFVIYALGHPELSFPWSNQITHILYGVYVDAVVLLFGTALSSCVNFFLSTNRQASAVGTIISAGYGFICGAYMPISSFSEGLQRVISFLPGTYGTSLLRNHTLGGVFAEMKVQGFPAEVVEAIRDSVDCNLYFFGDKVSLGTMYLVLTAAIVLALGIYVALNMISGRKQH